MKKKLMNGLELLFLIATVFVLAKPSAIVWKFSGTFDHIPPYESSMFDITSRSTFAFIVTFGLFVATAFLCLLSLLNKKKGPDSVVHSALPICLFAWLHFIISANMKSLDTIYSNTFPMALFNTYMIAVVVISFIKRTKLIAGEEVNQPANTITASTNADELKKYKNLLDSGAITQEEYDIKKKELLNL